MLPLAVDVSIRALAAVARAACRRTTRPCSPAHADAAVSVGKQVGRQPLSFNTEGRGHGDTRKPRPAGAALCAVDRVNHDKRKRHMTASRLRLP